MMHSSRSQRGAIELRVRIVEDYATADDPTPPVERGSIVDATIDPEYGDAWYEHPLTGETWFSFADDFEVVDQ